TIRFCPQTKLNLPLLGSKSARSISNSSQIPTPNGTTHGTTNTAGYSAIGCTSSPVHGAPRWGLGLRLRAARIPAHLPLQQPAPGYKLKLFPDYVAAAGHGRKVYGNIPFAGIAYDECTFTPALIWSVVAVD
ncbi:hypothetical protein B0H14DRAFT_3878569, partial [Mycena olivaceomarginata]